ncbi:SRPBCC family protein [Pendulispora rubella]|uniref:SRPBCC family protein n=1 Tax=Pendulispora rubella TaxID=2741070 RepID=A0ABZ2L261_9BACT
MLKMSTSSQIEVAEAPVYDTVQPEPAGADVIVAGSVRAPINLVWQLFRPFGPEIMRWWPIYDWVKLEPPGHDVVGAVRHFKSNGRTYRERLILRDDSTYTEQYEFVDSDVPIPIERAITTVQMHAVSDLETEVRWSSETKVNPLFLPVVKFTQRQAYYGAIESLARYFNPAVEILDVRVVGATLHPIWGVVPPNAYVEARIGSSQSHRTRVRPLNTRPRWNENLQFNLGAMDRNIDISIWSASLGRDTLLGTAKVEIPSALGTDWSQLTVILHGAAAGELVIAVRRRPEFQVLRETMSLAKTLGSRLGKFVPPLGQLGFEISMLDMAFANIESVAQRYLSQTVGTALHLGNGQSATDLAGTLLLDIGRAAAGVQNTIEGLAGQALALAQQVIESIKQGDQAVYSYERYKRLAQIPDVPLENLPRMVKGLPLQELLTPPQLGAMLQRGLEYAYSQFNLVERFKTALLQRKDPYESFLHGWVKKQPAVVDHWKDDAEFCRQLIQGLHPLVIRTVRSLAEIPPALLSLSAQGKSLEELIRDRRLFILDYALLAELKLYRNMVFYAPIVLVYRELLDDGTSRLNLVGIQLTRNQGLNVVYTAASSPPNRYLYAKIQVACADNQYHQFISHLGIAHLAMEPFIIAHHNIFYAHPEHPIGRLLDPHMRQTIGINYMARQTLVAPKGAFTDTTFAPGTAQALQLFLSAWEMYDFTANSFPEDLAARGFDEAGTDGVQGYYYRDDGFKIWRALETYIGEVVNAVYANDNAVAADALIQQWALETSAPDRADIPGFPRAITSRTQLVRTLTNIVFQASAFHSAVNFPQIDYLSYIPNRPDSTLKKMPEGEDDITMDFIYFQALPNFFVSNFQVSFAMLLTTPAIDTLWNSPGLAKEFPEIHRRFKENLQKISSDINERNLALEALGKQPYPYLDPLRIATSVAI